MKCDTCLHHCRPVISENGLHFICGLSDRKAGNCIMGKKDHYVENPLKREEKSKEDKP